MGSFLFGLPADHCAGTRTYLRPPAVTTIPQPYGEAVQSNDRLRTLYQFLQRRWRTAGNRREMQEKSRNTAPGYARVSTEDQGTDPQSDELLRRRTRRARPRRGPKSAGPCPSPARHPSWRNTGGGAARSVGPLHPQLMADIAATLQDGQSSAVTAYLRERRAQIIRALAG